MVATRRINPGEVVAIEAPYTNILLYDYYLTHCHFCLNPSFNLIPCSQCPLTLYCGEGCRDAAWLKYHRYECGILDTLHEIRATKLQLLALRIVLTLAGRLDAHYPRDLIYESGNYPEIHDLVTNEEHRTVSDLFARATVAATLIYLLEGTEFFRDCGDVQTSRYHTAILLLKHLQTAPSNMHEISELRGRPSSGNSGSKDLQSARRSFEVGYCLNRGFSRLRGDGNRRWCLRLPEFVEPFLLSECREALSWHAGGPSSCEIHPGRRAVVR